MSIVSLKNYFCAQLKNYSTSSLFLTFSKRNKRNNFHLSKSFAVNNEILNVVFFFSCLEPLAMPTGTPSKTPSRTPSASIFFFNNILI